MEKDNIIMAVVGIFIFIIILLPFGYFQYKKNNDCEQSKCSTGVPKIVYNTCMCIQEPGNGE